MDNDSSSRENPRWMAHGERWLIIAFLAAVLSNLDTPSEWAPVALGAVAALVALGAMIMEARERWGDHQP